MHESQDCWHGMALESLFLTSFGAANTPHLLSLQVCQGDDALSWNLGMARAAAGLWAEAAEALQQVQVRALQLQSSCSPLMYPGLAALLPSAILHSINPPSLAEPPAAGGPRLQLLAGALPGALRPPKGRLGRVRGCAAAQRALPCCGGAAAPAGQ